MSVERFSEFFMSPAGIGVTVVVCCVVLIMMAGIFYRKKEFNARVLTCSAVCIALSVLLSNVKIIHMPQGGSVTAFSMLFIVLVGYWFGPASGILAGVARGLLDMTIDPFIIHPMQLLLDYPLGFGVLGISGFFRNTLRNNTLASTGIKFDGLCVGYIAAALARWFMSFLSGFVFFAEYAGDQNPVIYSAVYNMSYILPEIVLTLIILLVPAFRNAVDYAARGRRAAA
ncbi:MAG: energy-coupled thiamine transporter ThiT [Clostridiales bacterium]|jgi:thiamine transporter|nr:energy-coupled thiamine transporter ThiT [Clostridiales bacterium]